MEGYRRCVRRDRRHPEGHSPSLRPSGTWPGDRCCRPVRQLWSGHGTGRREVLRWMRDAGGATKGLRQLRQAAAGRRQVLPRLWHSCRLTDGSDHEGSRRAQGRSGPPTCGVCVSGEGRGRARPSRPRQWCSPGSRLHLRTGRRRRSGTSRPAKRPCDQYSEQPLKVKTSLVTFLTARKASRRPSP